MQKKAARFRGIIDHNLTDNNLNQHLSNTNASFNDTLSNTVIEKDHLGDWSPEKDCC